MAITKQARKHRHEENERKFMTTLYPLRQEGQNKENNHKRKKRKKYRN